MKLRSNIIAGIIIVSFLLGATAIQAQGIYSDKNTTNKTADSKSGGGIFRGDGDDFGDDGEERPPAPGEDDPTLKQPIGEGILILTLLSGGYALIKRNVRRKNEE